MLRLHRCRIAPLGQARDNHDLAKLVIALHEKAPVTAGAFHQTVRVMSFTATLASVAMIAGGAVILLAAVLGFGCYKFLRDLFGKPPKQLEA